MILRGLDGRELVGESWSKLERQAYNTPCKRQDERFNSYYDLVLLVPGRAPIRCEVVFYRGCNCLAIPNDVVDLIPPEFADPIEAMEYAIKNGLETPPVLPFKESAR